MDITNRHFDVVLELTTPRFADNRGFFSETFNTRTVSALGIPDVFVQDNHALSHHVGTIRGLHFQVDPHTQGKLIRVLNGRINDVTLDIRPASATFGQHCAVELSAEQGNQLWIPGGFAHGFCTLEPDTEVFYKVTNHWNQNAERSIRWNDPSLAIDWGVTDSDATLSERDRNAPLFANWQTDSGLKSNNTNRTTS